MSRAGPSRKALSKKGWTKVVKEAIALVGIVCQENGFAKNLLHPLRGWSIYQKGVHQNPWLHGTETSGVAGTTGQAHS
jgi:hypothetical protein